MAVARVLPRLFAAFVISLALAVPAFALETFSDEVKAQQHCPKDVVVWLNLPTMIWVPNYQLVDTGHPIPAAHKLLLVCATNRPGRAGC
jgi:hypothetical protein